MENINLFSPESAAPTAGPLIPSKTLAWVGIKVRGLKLTKEKGGSYADLELTVADGPYKNRKMWIMICDPYDANNSESWRIMAVSAMTRIFESSQIFKVGDPASYQRFAGKPFQDIAIALDGIVAACEIKEAKDKTGSYPDKNDVAEWLSPNPVSGSVKKFTALIHPEQASDQARQGFLAGAQGPSSPAAAAAPPWAAAQAPAAPVAAPVAAPAVAAPVAAPAPAAAPFPVETAAPAAPAPQVAAPAPAAAGWAPPVMPASAPAAAPVPAPGPKPAWMQ